MLEFLKKGKAAESEGLRELVADEVAATVAPSAEVAVPVAVSADVAGAVDVSATASADVADAVAASAASADVAGTSTTAATGATPGAEPAAGPGTELDTSMVEKSCHEFSERLAAHEPIPGGGGASAYVGALGTALCTMVCHYTKGKPAYAAYDERTAHTIAATGRIRHELLELVDEDACAYECVTRAYALPRTDPGRPAAVEHALHTAAIPPYRIMVACARSLALLEELGDHVSKLLISDVACGALMCRAALQSASLTLYANTTAMADRECARELEAECDSLLATWLPRADALAQTAARAVRGKD